MTTATFGSNNAAQSFGATTTSESPAVNTVAPMTITCMDVYSHQSKTYSIPTGTTINSFFKDHLNIDANPKNFNIRINHKDAASGQPLQTGDHVLVTPTKIDGGM